MEVQLVRVNLNERYAGEDDIGRTPREIPAELIVQIGRKEERKEVLTSALDEKIEKGDVLYSLASGIAGDYHELEELGDLARELDIELTLHTPYYMDLADADGLAQKSVQSVIWGGMLAEAMRAPIVITHLGMFGELDPKEALNRIAKNLRTVRDAYKKAKIHSRLGIEASGRTEVVGSLDEILTLVKNAKGVLPVLNFAHVHARGFGLFKRPEDFDDVLSKVEKVSDGGHIHAHFSGVEHADGNELRYTPIKKGDLRFEPLAECLLDDDYDLTIVSSSPLLEHDAMYMKVILERVLAKRLMRPTKPEKEEKEEKEVRRRWPARWLLEGQPRLLWHTSWTTSRRSWRSIARKRSRSPSGSSRPPRNSSCTAWVGVASPPARSPCGWSSSVSTATSSERRSRRS